MAENYGNSTGVPDQSNSTSPQTFLSSCCPIALKFVEVTYRVKNFEKPVKGNIKQILNYSSNPPDQTPTTTTAIPTVQERMILSGITGTASPGEILAVLGPSGSGKSTLLNALAGRLGNQGNGLTGTILANGKKLSRSVLRRTGFVAQDDVLYPHLTVRETLVFCALLRLPQKLTTEEKVSVAESVISELGLSKCEDTIIGNSFVRGVSGGERKRVSIAHEMLMNPSLLVLDEPTSGLDSTAAYRLVMALGSVAHKGRTVVLSVHQPSSRVYQMFDKVLLLSEGKCLYFGRSSEAVQYFESVGFSPAFPMNPADFLLDLANGVHQFDRSSETNHPPDLKLSLASSYHTLLAPKIKASLLEDSTFSGRTNQIDNARSVRNNGSQSCGGGTSGWFDQFKVLMRRSLRERRHEAFNVLRVFQVIATAMLASVMWWRSEFVDVQDRLGLLFFVTIFWGVFPSFNSVFAFPQERAIFLKERASGMYSLSSYFMARIVGDMPMELVLPTLFLTLMYWMTGLRPDLGAYLLTLLALLGYVLVSQGLGLALGAAIMDAKKASTIVTVTMLAFLLTGGFYVHKVPYCLAWMKYVSTTFYCYKLLIYIQYGDGQRISSALRCHDMTDHRSASCTFVNQDVMGQIPPAVSVGALLLMFFGYRALAYLALRRIKTT
ncbi:hypothetical protein MLD38_033675 [Melastoma candidum]|uniref:Uncharacterized protein n=1 Tax=Melastoma candidum TaxID=119954 RepID=A0ACB9MA57_9MYRT|nr:hypothetical protein MLD38_033675 [Melastoma candidum]